MNKIRVRLTPQANGHIDVSTDLKITVVDTKRRTEVDLDTVVDFRIESEWKQGQPHAYLYLKLLAPELDVELPAELVRADIEPTRSPGEDDQRIGELERRYERALSDRDDAVTAARDEVNKLAAEMERMSGLHHKRVEALERELAEAKAAKPSSEEPVTEKAAPREKPEATTIPGPPAGTKRR